MADLTNNTKSSRGSPRVLLIDDQDITQSAAVAALYERGVEASSLHPEVVAVEDIQESDLVLVDYQLADWHERDGTVASRKPRTGLSLLALLRDHLSVATDRPVGFALNTSQFEQLPTHLPRPVTKHVFARSNNFEWIFDKDNPDDVPRICALAEACNLLPDDWHDTDAFDQLGKLLELPQWPWQDIARGDIDRCRPPIHELSRATDGLAVIRWLLHRVFSYPCFLYGRERLAVRLGIPVRVLDQLLSTKNSSLYSLLAPARYTGLLAKFSGAHWWGAGIDSILWDITEGRSFEPLSIRKCLEAATGITIDAPLVRFPVLAIDDEYTYLDHPVELASAIRIQPDDWPSYAEESWTTRGIVDGSPRLQALVLAYRS